MFLFSRLLLLSANMIATLCQSWTSRIIEVNGLLTNNTLSMTKCDNYLLQNKGFPKYDILVVNIPWLIEGIKLHLTLETNKIYI